MEETSMKTSIVKELGLVNKPSRESQKMVTIWIYLLSSNIHNYAASCIVQCNMYFNTSSRSLHRMQRRVINSEE